MTLAELLNPAAIDQDYDFADRDEMDAYVARDIRIEIARAVFEACCAVLCPLCQERTFPLNTNDVPEYYHAQSGDDPEHVGECYANDLRMAARQSPGKGV